MKPSQISLVLSFILLAVTPFAAQWVRTGGPSGGWISCMAANDQYVFAGTRNGLFQSNTGGESWHRLENDLPLMFTCLDLVSDGPHLLFKATDHAYEIDHGPVLYKSSTNGNTWSEIPYPDSIYSPDEIALKGDTIVIADDDILMSFDDGLTWNTVLSASDGFQLARRMDIHDDRLFILESRKLWITDDWGTSWEVVQLPTGVANNFHAYGFYQKDNLLVVVDVKYAYRSLDFGLTWEQADGWAEANPATKDIVEVNDVLYANSLHVLRSSNQGLTWAPVPSSSGDIYPHGLITFDENLFIYEPYVGIHKYSVQDAQFTTSDDGVDAVNVASLVVLGNDLWAGATTQGLYRYDLIQEQWDSVNYLAEFNSGVTVVSDLAGVGAFLLAANRGRIYRTDNPAQGWTEVFYNPWDYTINLHVVGDTVYSQSLFGGLSHVSADFGLSWQPVYPDAYYELGSDFTGVLPFGGHDFACTWDSVYRSDDGGATWIAQSEDIDIDNYNITGLYSGGDFIIAEYHFRTGGNAFLQLFASFDHGESWHPMMDGLPPIAAYDGTESVMDLEIRNDTLFAAFEYNGTFFMPTEDMFWRPLKNAGIFPYEANTLALWNNKLFVGTSGMSVWELGSSYLPTNVRRPVATTPMEIVPNPASSEIRISIENGSIGSGTVHLFGADGTLILSAKMRDEAVVPVGHLPAGTYIVLVHGANRIYTGKFVRP